MPNMGGYEVCKRIKKINKNIKVIIFTGFVDIVDAGMAKDAGADDYVVKTSDFNILFNAAKKIVKN